MVGCMGRLFALLTLLAWAGAVSAAEVRVEGKLSFQKKPASGVKIMAYPANGPSFSDSPLSSPPVGEDGAFSLSLAPGRYYFVAQGGGLYCFYGRNPVTVPEGGLKGVNIALTSLDVKPPASVPQVATGVLGSVTYEGKPLAGVVIYVYTDLNSDLKGMGLGLSSPTDERGEFHLSLEPGTYFLVARQRAGGAVSGPLQAGDFFGYLPSNPLVIKPGEVARVAIPMVEVPEKVEQLAGSLFGQTSVEGQVLDKEGKPVAEMYVLLYDDPAMLARPLFVSRKTGADGRFVLSFPEGGQYFLAARSTIGGAPQPGDLIGSYEGSLKVDTAEHKKGVSIKVDKLW